MFTLTEAAAWSVDETLLKVMEDMPVGWRFHDRTVGNTFYAWVTDDSGAQVWSGEQQDRKLLLLDCLGWLRIRGHQTSNPMWRARASEVPLHRPSIAPSPVPDPPDLDPDEISAVYKTSR